MTGPAGLEEAGEAAEPGDESVEEPRTSEQEASRQQDAAGSDRSPAEVLAEARTHEPPA